MTDFFSDYEVGEFFDEMFSGPGAVRPHYGKLLDRFKEMERSEFDRKRALAASTSCNRESLSQFTTTSKARNEFSRSI